MHDLQYLDTILHLILNKYQYIEENTYDIIETSFETETETETSHHIMT